MRKSFGIDVVLKIAFVQHDDVMCKDFFSKQFGDIAYRT
ncbi:hypothetical protein LEP1GSC125_1644 [Leptospira mayottensis 200901122]|uniref:Uncharacterized protein n=1 Tax=Leptospira mayottensis 200901122 TaxID=1193010 RepID=A0AA87SVB3_9LEPT|nr:hypothetical protein LEP1GSC125_1644 [Leptospira mayottensis 200901122]